MMQVQYESDAGFLEVLQSARPEQLEVTMSGQGCTHRFEVVDRRLEEHVLWFILGGSIEGVCSGESEPVIIREGDFHWLAPGVTHTLKKVDDGRLLRNYLIRFRLKCEGAVIAPRWTRRQESDFVLGRDALEKIYETVSIGADYTFEKLRALLVALFIDLINVHKVGDSSSHSDRLTHRELKLLVAESERPRAPAMSPGDLASVLGLTRDYFSRKFRNTTGLSPRAWLSRQRMRRGAWFLQETPMSLKEIARELGMDDERLFARQFKARFGCTPTEYRRRMG